MAQNAKLPTFDGVVKSVSSTKDGADRVKTREDGTTARYDLCAVEVIHNGKTVTVFANRTLESQDGTVKQPVSVGDKVSIVCTGLDPESNRPWFEIGTGARVDDDATIMDALGLNVGQFQPANTENAEQA
jgi:hypothetical protein